MNNQFTSPNGNGQPQEGTAFIRLFHASPDAPAVDVYANGRLLAKGITYKQLTRYLSVPSGNYSVEVFPADQKMNPVISTVLQIVPNTVSTIAAVGKLAEIVPLIIREEYMPKIDRNKSYIRFVHLSPDAPPVDITLPDGTKIFEDVEFTESTNYIQVAPGTYAVQVRPAGESTPVLSLPSVVLKPGIIYSAYAVGLLNGEPRLEGLLITDSSFVV
jgi:hypothetical protein